MLSWKQHSPHYTVNHDEINIGLGTFHGTAGGEKKVMNYAASRFFREHFSVLHGVVRHGNFSTTLRRNVFRVFRRLGVKTHQPKTEFLTEFRLDPTQSNGLSNIRGGPVKAECSIEP